jgi:hypothetical protein
VSRVQPAPARPTRPKRTERQRASYLTKRMAAAHAVLADLSASDQARRAARCRINRTLAIIRRLAPIPRMKRRLAVDKKSVRQRRLFGAEA